MSQQPSSEATTSDDGSGGKTQAARDGQPSEFHVPLTIARQYVKDFSFENPGAPAIYDSLRDQNPDLKVSVDIAANPLERNHHEVVLSLSVNAAYRDTTAFIIELHYAAQVEVGDRVSQDKLERALMVEVPRYLFPFLRHIVANATREGGFPPLLLSPINFLKIQNRRHRKQAPAAAKE